MNPISDPSKRTSINSLLNPEATATSFSPPLSARSLQSTHHRPVEGQSVPFTDGASFHLRAADWSTPDSSGNGKQDCYDLQYHHQINLRTPGVYTTQSSERACTNYEEEYMREARLVRQSYQDEEYGAPIAPLTYSEEHKVSDGHCVPQNRSSVADREDPAKAWQKIQLTCFRLPVRESMSAPDTLSNLHRSSNCPYLSQAYTTSQKEAHHSSPLAPAAGDPHLQITPVTQGKRSTPEDGISEPPKAKRSKSAGSKSGSTKRCNNGKEDAMQVQWSSTHHTTTIEDKGKQKAPDSPATIVSVYSDDNAALYAELQSARCMSNKYRNDAFPRCVSCTRRWAGDTCRFQGIRFFIRDMQGGMAGISFVETHKTDRPTMNFPKLWNTRLASHHIKRTKETIAAALLPVLRKELKHLEHPELIYRPRECDVRATCDTCMTSIFSTSWMCRTCGREACAECFLTVQELTEDPPECGDEKFTVVRAKREKHARDNPFFLSCTRRNEHQSKDFSPMSRFRLQELRVAIDGMEKLIQEDDVEPSIDVQDRNVDIPNSQNVPNLVQPEPEIAMASDRQVADPDRLPYGSNVPNFDLISLYTPPILTETVRNTPSHPLRRYKDSELTEMNFPSIWSLGQPLVVTGLLSKLKVPWTPEYFIEQYGTQSCVIIECQTEVNKRVTVGEFFSGFGKYEGRTECWKLKDWPSSTDFRLAFPELYDDFSSAVPVPSYVRRDGVLNLASHFPSNAVAPDLGPKMYNAMASSQEPGSKGSTRLHMDMADALNIMTYATPCIDGSLGCAVWDLFRAEDSDKLRAFLSKKFNLAKVTNGDSSVGNGRRSGAQGPDLTVVIDPIHGQQFYLDEKLRLQLYEETGVMSYRLYQRPGEAVFIPAGCAHQVANLADCIKVAIDFVSPENIERCEKLTKEFREQNQRKVWKEDVLQLRTMMWFAWLSCRQQELELVVENGDTEA